MKQKLNLYGYPDLEAAELVTLNNLKKFNQDQLFEILFHFMRQEPEIRLKTALALAAVLMEEK